MENKKTIILLAVVIIIIAGLVAAVLSYRNKPQNVNPNDNVNPNNNVSVNNFEECAALNYIIMESYPRQCRTPEGQTFVENIGNELEKIDLIRLSNPRPNQEIKSPLSIEGEARGNWFFEASFPIKLYDADNNLLAQAIAQAQGDWMTSDFVAFKAELNFSYPESATGILVLEKDNPSGLPENADQLRVPVKFFPDAEDGSKKIKVKVFFNNSKLDPEISCNKVFSTEREIIKTPAVARAALTELLAGTTSAEKEAGFTTSLNPGIKIQSLTIENGVAKVDFDEELEAQVGGSCRVAAISAQIRETLKQFSTVKDVIISINGRSEDILQP